MLLSACAYDTHFEDCAVRCTTDVSCPEDLSCEAEGFCRTPGTTETCAAILETSASCAGLPATCGPNSDEDCCASPLVPGGAFFRSFDVAGDGMYPSTAYPATVSDFRLDRFEVTVARFRTFVEAGMGTRLNPPIATAGTHAKIAGSGWNPSWNDDLAADTAALVTAIKCDPTYQTWTDTAGANENLPINCVDWFEAAAFCIWDGGFLPSEAEWNYAAAGGDEQRAYPWSSPAGATAIDCSYANYAINAPSGAHCVNGTIGALNDVGTESPKGDGRWRHIDISGNVYEWALDWFALPYANPCIDCANLTTTAGRAVRGGNFNEVASNLRNSFRTFFVPNTRVAGIGVRCARLSSL